MGGKNSLKDFTVLTCVLFLILGFMLRCDNAVSARKGLQKEVG